MAMEFAIRVTDRCNLNCAYCYARVANPKDMSLATLEHVLTEIVALSDDPVTISWTGGEPLLMGHEFFTALINFQAFHGADRFINIIQSNLTLLDDWFVQFFAENHFQVRTSLDLPPENHDALRRSGDFQRSLNSIARLQLAGVAINVNTVLTGHNIDQPDVIFASLKRYGITSFSVSRLVEQGNAIGNTDIAIYDNAAFGRFLIRMFDLWMADTLEPKITRITPLDKLLAACQRGTRDENAKCFHCQSQLFAIGPDGLVFPSCNKFFALPDTCLGDLNRASLRQLLDSNERRQFLTKTGDVSTRVCGECEYVDLCEGGCYYVAFNASRKGENMHSREQFCKGYYLVFEHLLNHLAGR
jgi:uncharacterized protein